METTTTLLDGGASLTSKQTFAYDRYNNQTDAYNYDFYNGQVWQLLRRTHTDYVTDTNYTGYTGTNPYLMSLPLQTWVSADADGINKASKTEFKYDETALTPRDNTTGWTNPDNTYRGNLTRTLKWLKYASEPESWLETKAEYDALGNVVKVFDAEGNFSTIDYADRFGSPNGEAQGNWSDLATPAQLSGLSTYAFPTRATNAMNWTTNYTQFDYHSGLTVDAEDINGNVSSAFYNDLLDRPTQAIMANNRPTLRNQKTFTYQDDNRKVIVTADLFAFGDNLAKTESFYDKLGRTTETWTYKGGGYIISKQEYDALGRAYRQANPYRGNETVYWTTSEFDALFYGVVNLTKICFVNGCFCQNLFIMLKSVSCLH